ncbi:MAG TPA: ribonuclease J [Candidatus Caccenecus avistercoris]|nr:ribonuclease J [Candidatus Caccenecus avistercoris]
MKNNSNITSIFALGGLGEVGKNMYVITHNEEIIIIDAGVMFPEDDLLGIDYVIQDITYLKQNENKIKGLFITHGHEDHIGGISFLLNSVNIPKIYASKISADLINKKLIDRNIKYENIEIVNEDTIIKTKYFTVEFVGTTHSIPESFALAIHTPNGVIFETGDFKFDLTPIGPMANIHKMAELGKHGVTLLLSDSTNALSPGSSKSESSVDEALNDIVSKHFGRVIIATFASNIYRIKHIVETCRKNNRKIIIFGRSMETSIELAMNNGLIEDKTIFIDNNEAKGLKKNEICILCTGTQGEPLAALSRIASGTHKQITLMPDDLVVFSSSPIPGNAASINKVINKLYLKGVKVFTNKTFNDVHTSGHAKEEELKWMLRIIKPKYFMPMHGEYRMLKRHTEIAVSCDIPKENTFICKNGDVINIKDGIVTRGDTVKSGDIYVDGSRIGDVGSQIIKDRKLMSSDGILVTILNINSLTRKLLIKPNVTTRGFIMVNENPELINKIEKKITEIVNTFLANNAYNYTDLKNQIILELYPFINDLTGRHPIILPVIMEVNQA